MGNRIVKKLLLGLSSLLLVLMLATPERPAQAQLLVYDAPSWIVEYLHFIDAVKSYLVQAQGVMYQLEQYKMLVTSLKGMNTQALMYGMELSDITDEINGLQAEARDLKDAQGNAYYLMGYLRSYLDRVRLEQLQNQALGGNYALSPATRAQVDSALQGQQWDYNQQTMGDVYKHIQMFSQDTLALANLKKQINKQGQSMQGSLENIEKEMDVLNDNALQMKEATQRWVYEQTLKNQRESLGLQHAAQNQAAKDAFDRGLMNAELSTPALPGTPPPSNTPSTGPGG